MAKYRQLHTTFWNDSLILDLTPEQKYFYIYLLTNPNVTQCGIYEISIKQISYHTGYNVDTVKHLLELFEDLKKIVYSKDTNELLLINFLKFNASESPSIRKCIEKDLKAVKNKDLIKCIQGVDTVYTEYGSNNKNKKKNYKEEEEEKKERRNGVDYYNNIAFPNYFDIHYSKRIEQDEEMTKKYHAHLRSLGYERIRSYNGEAVWRKTKKTQKI
tara:strand:- start:1702 stop:2346 length:645 start_codon:yes stop_codon:yes gene_type:complete